MQLINALSLAPDAHDWLANSRHPRILHVFNSTCNLINERREVLSIVTPQIGNGPFNLVIEDDVLFSDHLHAQSPISIHADRLNLGELTIHTGCAKLWSPRPDWERLHTNKEAILNHLRITNYQECGLDTGFATTAQPYSTTSLQSLVSNLSFALANADITTAKKIAAQLAGLGQGLTPTGDDHILGAMYAVLIIHPPEISKIIAEEIADTAAPLTTSLSAAYLKSAGRGAAGILWHNFFDALSTGDLFTIQVQITKILSIGHSSGADALAGFIGTLISYAESEAKLCHS